MKPVFKFKMLILAEDADEAYAVKAELQRHLKETMGVTVLVEIKEAKQ